MRGGLSARMLIEASALSACSTIGNLRSPSGHTMWSIDNPCITASVNTGAMSSGDECCRCDEKNSRKVFCTWSENCSAISWTVLRSDGSVRAATTSSSQA